MLKAIQQFKRQSKLFFLIPFLLFFVGVGTSHLLVLSLMRYFPVPKSEVFFTDLRDHSTAGCMALDHAPLDYLVVGDSHSYAAIDFLHFSRLTNTTKIGSCTLGGFYFETLIYFLTQAKSIFTEANAIIYGLSYRQFTNGENKDRQILAHNEMISKVVDNAAIDYEIVNSRFNSYLEMGLRSAEISKYNEKISKWTPVINSLGKQKVEQIFNGLENKSSVSWKSYLAHARMNSNFEDQLKEFCNLVKVQKLKVIVVDIPESDHLRGLYSAEQKAEYVHIKQRLKTCVYALIDMSTEQLQMQSSYFVNRELADDWGPNLNSKKNATSHEMDNLYDYDHMNPIGSVHFTEKMIQEILPLMKMR